MLMAASIRSDDDYSFTSPRTLAYFYDNSAAHEIVESVRWDDKKYCPRCHSTFTKKVNTHIFRELQRCVDCGYMFNTLSGTLFHGAKVPLIKYLQLFVIDNALDEAVSLREICYVLDVSYKTASSLYKRLKEFDIKIKFAFIDKETSDKFKLIFDGRKNEVSSDTFFSYCEMKYIVLDEKKFTQYLKEISRSGVPARAAVPDKA